MARPKDADSAETYDAVVRAARELLAEMPNPSALSMRQIAVAADVSLGTLHYYFESKEDLLEACMEVYYTRLGKVVQELTELSQKLSGRPLVEEAARRAFRFVNSEKALTHLRRTTSAKRGELHPQRQKEIFGHVLTSAATALEPHVEIDHAECRLAIQSMAILVARFALLTDSEREHLVGDASDAGRAVIEEFIVQTARRLVRPHDG